ncbi:hypothetical protein VTO42DRAFT_239 [Malbranchea cinnamomea]
MKITRWRFLVQVPFSLLVDSLWRGRTMLLRRSCPELSGTQEVRLLCHHTTGLSVVNPSFEWNENVPVEDEWDDDPTLEYIIKGDEGVEELEDEGDEKDYTDG